jgi:sugar-specific transcriptional regulator TrmB
MNDPVPRYPSPNGESENVEICTKICTLIAMKQLNLPLIFKRLGMSKHAHKVYETVLKRGPLLATEIVSGTGVYRPAVYRALYELLDEKLLIRTKDGKRHYWSAASPNKIEKLFSDALGKVSDLLPREKPRAEESITGTLRLFHGPEGIRAVFDDVIEHTPRGETFYRYTSERNVDKVNSYLSKDYRDRRDRKKLERLVISNPLSGRQKRPRLERFIKYIQAQDGTSLFEQNVIQIVYGRRIALIDLNTEESMIIDNPALAEFQKVIFRQLYKKL